MKIIVFTDIHGNFEILKALSQTNDFKDSDLRICLGDCIDNEMQNNECLEFLEKTKTICLFGNYEGRITDWFYEEYTHLEKNIKKNKELKDSINEHNYNFIINTFIKNLYLDFGQSKWKFCHYKWANDNSLSKRIEDNQLELVKLYSLDKFDNIIFGHSHNFTMIHNDNQNLICIGSLGYKCPAPYLTIDTDISIDNFKRLNTQYIDNISKIDISYQCNTQMNVSTLPSKELFCCDNYSITLNFINYDANYIKNFYNTTKIQKRNFDLTLNF